ncbi:sn-glycerol-3-phosphate ABC transporter ATP-binding protein UgpC [Paroceanicella profunda]|uniref:sn-glycerol-3-phosphate ABC transporter ATP-binding protein UgpC n=1 Tax=Paroceanicella profunda TaxID=2579971 RepID=A0A5B8FWX2_9RHOB|nr:sn-glycerol-3-phosphate ABC transporter ATP-binding protein UgpC [Paroceanicella profunda]QDL93396.1 sn-glycerol-3-phosphate ABC transporter ATP-binding protein UgpC [Paroceanicella profunda]
MTELSLRGLRKSFGGHEAIHGVDLDIPSGEFVVFVGPSGCGKSTLLRLIAGLEDISAGELSIGGAVVNALPPAKRGISMVFQSYALYPHMTVFENIAFGLTLKRRDKAEVDARVREVAATLELTELLERLPRELSGGQRQRVAIGRAIVRQPKVFLFDEPLSNLDAALRTQMRGEIADLHARLPDVTMIYVTHDQVEAMTLADRIVVLRDGRVEQVGRPLELYHEPANLFVAGFIGAPSMNVLPVKVSAAGAQGLLCDLGSDREVRLPLTIGGSPEAVQTLGIRPEHLVEDPEGVLAVTVERIENLGESHLIHARLPGGATLIARGSGAVSAAAGDRMRFALPPEHVHLFLADGRTAAARHSGTDTAPAPLHGALD